MSSLFGIGANGAANFYNGVVTTSLRLDKASSTYLYRTPSSATNRRTFTISFWYKTSIVFASTASDQNNPIFYADEPSGGGLFALNVSSQGQGAASDTLNEMQYYDYDSADTTDYGLETNSSFADPSAWYHLVWAFDTTQGTEANRVKVYINGVQRAYTDMNQHHGAVVQNRELNVNQSTPHWIGRNIDTTTRYMNGYLADFNFIDGTQYDASYFGETKNGVWIPIEPSVTYGTNGFRLQFKNTSVGSGSSSTIGADTSGNDNHFTSSGIAASDCAMPDSPENNFCTINSIREDTLVNGSITISEGGLQSVDASTTYGRHWSGTFGMSTGKWYWEVLAHTLGGNYANIGLGNDVERGTTSVANGAIGVYYGNDGKRNPRAQNSGTTSYGATYTDGDIIGIAFDADNESVTFYKNGSTQGAVGSVLVQSTGPYFPSVGDAANGSTYKYVANWGQDGTFAGNKTAQGNADGSGIGDFFYSPPSGYLALCSSNLSEPTIGPNSATQADDYFKTALYTGTGSSGNAINTVGFQTDWLWIKRRNGATSHRLIDSSRGVDRYLSSDTSNAEDDATGIFTSFDSNGFTVEGTANATNGNNNPYVSWNWKANGGTTTTNDASATSVGSIDSVIQANTEAGFSIVQFETNSGTSGSAQTVAHGLSQAPTFMILKSRDQAGATWQVYYGDNTDYLRLDSDGATIDGASTWNDTSPTNTVFSIGTNGGDTNNTNGGSMIAYVFHDVEGYSKFGSYTGNGSADGTFVFTGFKPAWVMIKNTARSAHWRINDITRQDRNNAGYSSAHLLAASSNSAEVTNEYDIDFLSNGFKLRSSDVYENANNELFIYMAFAEAPFKYSNAH